jgi:hypothetical protein
LELQEVAERWSLVSIYKTETVLRATIIEGVEGKKQFEKKKQFIP